MFRKSLGPCAIAFGIAMLLPSYAGGQSPGATPQRATADIINAQNEKIGTATFTAAPHGVLITIDAANLPPGPHGVHLHEAGVCEPPDFQSAKGHIGVGAHKHGLMNAEGPEAGDLPNLFVGSDGRVRAEFLSTTVDLGTGPTGLLDADGSAIVIHAAQDDQVTQPIGNSGGRIACGVIRRAS